MAVAKRRPGQGGQVVGAVDPVKTNTAAIGSTNGLTGNPTPEGLPTAGPGQIMHGNQPGVPPSAGWVAPNTPPPATTPTTWGANTPLGFDPTKMASGHDSPKYQIGQVLSNFDYKQGITPELLAALNGLGLGTFNQLDADEVEVTGNVDPRFEGFTTIDLIQDAANGGSAWQYLTEGGGGGNAAPTLPNLSGVQGVLGALGSGGGGGGNSAPAGPTPPKPAPDWVWTGSGWVPPSHPLAANPQPEPGSQGGGTTTGSSSSAPLMGNEIRETIMNLLQTGGQFNQNLLDQRAESLREGLERQRGVETSTLDAVLADRGLTGSGADIEARVNMGERLGSQYGTALRDLTSDEARAADQRMMQALQTGAGMTISEAQQAIDWYNAATGRTSVENQARQAGEDLELRRLLGLGNLGLGQAQLEANYLLGQGGLAVQQAQLGQNSMQALVQQLLQSLGIQAGSTPNY